MTEEAGFIAVRPRLWHPSEGRAALAAIFLAFTLLPPLAWSTAHPYLIDLGTRIMIFSIAAIGLDLLAGYAGLVSFGYAAFLGLGAYAVGILSANGVSEALISLPAAIGASMLFAWVTGIICLRTKGAYFIMITLAFGQMAYFVAISLEAYGGDNGLSLSARSTVAGLPLLKSDGALYYGTLAALTAILVLCRALAVSRFGRVIRGAKENPTRMAATGFDVGRFQLIAYVLSGGCGGLAGFLLANATEFVSPAYMSWQRSGELLVMVILGGFGTLYGAVLGTAAYLLAEEWLPLLSENWKVLFGPLLVLIVLFARGGLVGLVVRLGRN